MQPPAPVVTTDSSPLSLLAYLLSSPNLSVCGHGVPIREIQYVQIAENVP